MKNAKERRPSLKTLLERTAAETDRAREAAGELRRQLDDARSKLANSERQRHDLTVMVVNGDKRLGVAQWALELAYEQNRALRVQLDFLRSPEEMAKRDTLAIAG